MAVMFGELSILDIAIIVTYLVVILTVGLAATLRPNRSNAEGYFLAGGTITWFQVGCSLFASNIGSEHFVGLASTAAASGYAVVLFEWLAVWVIQISAWCFLPVYMASAIYTMPEYLGKRYGGDRIRIFIAVLSLVVYIFAKMSVDLYAGALLVKVALHWDLYISIVVLLLVSAIYTAAGGLAAIVYTETVQAVILVIGGSFVSIYAFREIGGLHNLERTYMSSESYPNETLANNSTCGIPRGDSLHIWRGLDADLPWLSFLLGQTWCSMWYWASDQVIVQRFLGAKNLSHGKGAALFASVLKISPMFLMILPGMVSRVLYADEVACVEPDKCQEICESSIGCYNIAYPKLVVGILPHGVRGLVAAVMLSALMSSLASTFNSSSAIFTLDIWTKIRKLPVGEGINQLSQEARRKYNVEIMIVGRICVFVLVIASVAWIPVVQGSSGSQLFMYIQDVICTISPPITAVFFLGIFWERANEKGAFAGLLCGFIISVCRMLISFIWNEPSCGQPDTRPPFITVVYIHYQWFSLALFVTTVLIIVTVSLLSEPIPQEYLYRLTFWTRFSRKERKDIALLTSPEEQPILGDGAKFDIQSEQNGLAGMSETSFSRLDGHEIMQSFTQENRGDKSKGDGKIKGDLMNLEHTQDIEESTNEKTSRETHLKVLISCWKLVAWFFGISHTDSKQKWSEDQMKVREMKQMDKIVEQPFHQFVLLIVLGLVTCAYLFLYIFYA